MWKSKNLSADKILREITIDDLLQKLPTKTQETLHSRQTSFHVKSSWQKNSQISTL